MRMPEELMSVLRLVESAGPKLATILQDVTPGLYPSLTLRSGQVYFPTMQLLLDQRVPEVKRCTVKEFAELLNLE